MDGLGSDRAGHVKQAAEEELHLSADALEALKAFSLDKGLEVDPQAPTFRKDLQDACDMQEKDATYSFDFGQFSKDKSDKILISVAGLKKELGQTLDSTGLTLWAAAEHMCGYINTNRDVFKDAYVLELGAGLGLCGLLASYFAQQVVLTDGDPASVEGLERNCQEQEDSVWECRGEPVGVSDGGTGEYASCRELAWGRGQVLEDFLCDCVERGLCSSSTGFDIIIGADLVYEQACLGPLFETVARILAMDDVLPPKPPADDAAKTADAATAAPTSTSEVPPPPPSAASSRCFLLGFTHRNLSCQEMLRVALECGLKSDFLHPFNDAGAEGIYKFTLSA